MVFLYKKRVLDNLISTKRSYILKRTCNFKLLLWPLINFVLVFCLHFLLISQSLHGIKNQKQLSVFLKTSPKYPENNRGEVRVK